MSRPKSNPCSPALLWISQSSIASVMGRMPKRIKNHAFHLSCVSNYWWNFNYQEKNTNHESKLILWERSFWSSLFNPAESTGILQVRHCFQWGPSPSLTVSAIASPKSCLLFSRSRRACRETKRLVKCTEKVSAKSKKKNATKCCHVSNGQMQL